MNHKLIQKATEIALKLNVSVKLTKFNLTVVNLLSFQMYLVHVSQFPSIFSYDFCVSSVLKSLKHLGNHYDSPEIYLNRPERKLLWLWSGEIPLPLPVPKELTVTTLSMTSKPLKGI